MDADSKQYQHDRFYNTGDTGRCQNRHSNSQFIQPSPTCPTIILRGLPHVLQWICSKILTVVLSRRSDDSVGNILNYEMYCFMTTYFCLIHCSNFNLIKNKRRRRSQEEVNQPECSACIPTWCSLFAIPFNFTGFWMYDSSVDNPPVWVELCMTQNLTEV